MHDLLHDLRFALRGLRHRPGFSLVAILTLALAIGAVTAMYTVIEGVLLNPLDYPDPEEIVVVQEKNPEAGFPRFTLSPLNYRDYRDMSESFEHFAAGTGASLAWTPESGGAAQRLRARAVTHQFLEVFGIQPVVGRDIGPEHDQPDAPPTVLISYDLWQRLGGETSIVDSDLRLDGEATRVLGVLPQDVFEDRDALIPLGMDWEEGGRGGHWLMGYARLADGVEVDSARADLERVAAGLAAEYPETNRGWGSIVDPLQGRMVEDVETALWVLLAAVGAVLLIACANVANLTLTRLARREREVALRSALGAGRWRLLRQMLLESLLLALLAGGLGVVLARFGVPLLVSLDAGSLPRAETLSIDGTVLLVSLGMTLLTALLFGLAPALSAARPDLAGTMKDGGRGHVGGRRGQTFRKGLVLAEVALALVLSIAAGLLVRSYGNLLGTETGFDAASLWTASVNLPRSAYGEDAEKTAFYERLVEEARALPGVEQAALVMPMPLAGGDYVLAFFRRGMPRPEPSQEPNANVRFVSDGYFDTLGIPLLRGRPVSSADRDEAPEVIVINRSAAETFWPDQDPIGRQISFGRADTPAEDVEWITIVGVVADVRHSSVDGEPAPAFYRSILQATPGFATVALRTAGDPALQAAPLRDVVRRLDPNLPLFDEKVGSALVGESLAEPRFNATLLGLFAGLALVLAAGGVFGVVSYGVAQQVGEIGVRMALGAGARRIVGWVVAQGLRPVLWGIGVGLVGAVLATRLLDSLVYGVPTLDLGTYLLVALGLASVSAVACLVPALRASRVEPVAVLRDE